MDRVSLAVGGPSVGRIGLGCMGMTHAYDPQGRDEDSALAVLRQAQTLGVTLIDTADVYGPYTNEELVGRALKLMDRATVTVATKVGLVLDDDTDGKPTYSNNARPEHIRASVDASLRRLGLDHIDLYQLHRVNPDVPLEETWGALAETVRQGKVRHLGLSEVTPAQISAAAAVHPVTSVQSELSLWTRDALPEVLPYCRAHEIAFLAYAPLGRGFLTGRFTRADDLPQHDQRRHMPRFQKQQFDANLALVDTVTALAQRYERTPAEVALAWITAQGPRVIPIPGTKSLRNLRTNARAGDLHLSDSDLKVLDDLPAAQGSRT
ncbi:aldo/keto reductase [Streptomyces sp. NPDC001904]|uniref:aldo/keto reductase n=1 Tax=Streptomyces sp. NPDC001904 TaxID=3154531 RepID=UPI00331EADEA